MSKSNLDYNDSYQDTSLLYSAVTTELIEDNALKYLINTKGEIQVGKIIYKISPFGTFYTDAKNEIELEKVYDLVAEMNDVTIRVLEPSTELNFSNIDKQTTEQLDVYLLNNKVYFIDTFKETANLTNETTKDSINNEANKITSLNLNSIRTQSISSRQTSLSVPENPFVDMDTHSLNFRSGAGGIWDTYFTNQTKYKYFDSKYRISVLFYNRNYAITKSLGIKVKLQKKGWFWWNSTQAQEIITGWERMVYKQVNSQPAFTRPTNSPPLDMNPNTLYVNPFAEKPAYGYFTSNKISLYKWNFGRANSELFSLMIPYYLLPGTSEDITVQSSAFKPIVIQGWDWLKDRLVKSVPGPSPLIVAPDPYNYKFPIFDVNNGTQSFLSINEMENMPKAFNTEPNKVYNVIAGQKIRTYISPYLNRVKNTDMIDIPLEFSTATISLSLNPNSPISFSNVLNSLNIS